jgi:prefoldin subunit 5
MPLDILNKQKQVDQLAAQLASLQEEIKAIRELNPEYTKTLEQLQKNKKQIIKQLKQPIKVEIPGIVCFMCMWKDVGLWPEITNWSFLMTNENDNKFIEHLLIECNAIESIFNSTHPAIITLTQQIEELDKQVIDFNTKVKIAHEKFNEESIHSLAFVVSVD